MEEFLQRIFFIQGAFPMGSKNIHLSLQSCFLTFSISKLKSRARSNFTLMPLWMLTCHSWVFTKGPISFVEVSLPVSQNAILVKILGKFLQMKSYLQK